MKRYGKKVTFGTKDINYSISFIENYKVVGVEIVELEQQHGCIG